MKDKEVKILKLFGEMEDSILSESKASEKAEREQQWEKEKKLVNNAIAKIMPKFNMIITKPFQKSKAKRTYTEIEIRTTDRKKHGNRDEIMKKFSKLVPKNLKPKSGIGDSDDLNHEKWASGELPWIILLDREDHQWVISFKPAAGEQEARAEWYEAAICNSWNEMSGEGKTDYKVKGKVAEPSREIAKLLGKQEYMGKKVSGEAVWFGTVSGIGVSDFWKKYCDKPKDTPKTDMVIKGLRISLKMGDKAQLTSGKMLRGEGDALIYYAIEESDVSKKLSREITQWFKLDETGASKILARSKEELKKKGEEYFKINRGKLTEKINEAISTSNDFHHILVREGMEGAKKFEGRNPEAIAEYVLAGAKDGSKIAMHKIEDSYIEDLIKAGRIRVYVAIKSSKGYQYASLRAQVNKQLEKMATMHDVIEALDDENVHISLSDINEMCQKVGIEQILEEGVVDDVKEFFGKVVNAIGTIIRRSVGVFLEKLGIDTTLKVEGDKDWKNWM